jgi:hypothetical protein
MTIAERVQAAKDDLRVRLLELLAAERIKAGY